MSIVKTKAVVLRSRNYREKSKIITFYTEEHGKIQCIAKGVRDIKSKFGSVLQNMSYLDIIYYYKENRSLHLLSSAEYERAFQNIYSDINKTEIAYKMVDVLNNTTFENLKNKEIFNLCVSSLEHLDLATKNYINVFFYFEFQLAKLLGFGINLFEEDPILIKDECLKYENGDYKGENAVHVFKHTKNYNFENLHNREKEIVRKLAGGNLYLIDKIKISKNSEKVIGNFLEYYYNEHFDNPNFSKVNKVIKSNEVFN